MPRSTVRHWVRKSVVAVVVAAFLVGCGETTVNAPLPVGTLAPASTAPIHGQAGQPVPEPVGVLVMGTDGQPFPGAEIAFAPSHNGSVSPATATSDHEGIARTRWTLGQAVGTNTLTATAESGTTTTITATVTAGAPASIVANGGDNQTAAARSAVTNPPSVRVTDAFGNLAEGVTIIFSVVSGGGQVTQGVRTTNSQGIAAVGSWTLGPVVGSQSLAARADANGVANNPVVFNATATPPTGATMTATAGNNQRARVGHLVPIAPTVVVRDAAGTGIAGVIVTFSVASGGGIVVGGRQVTDATGTAAVGGWFLGDLPGVNTLVASGQGLTSVTFTATADPGVPTSMVAVSPTTFTGVAGANVSSPPSVVVRDVSGLPVAGVVVTFTVTAGGGSVVGSPATSGANGVATLTSWRLGNVAGVNTVIASAAGLPSVTFTATGTAGNPAVVVVNAGDNQAAVQGTTVAVAPSVRVNDANGNPVTGAAVTFAVVAGSGSATGLSQVTNAQGIAAVGSWTLGVGAPNSLRATVTGSGITNNPITFTAQSATQITITSAPAGPLNKGVNFAITVQLRNSLGAAVSLAGVPLSIAIATNPGGGPTLNGTTSNVLTLANGTVTFSVNVTGGNAGGYTFTISGAGLASATTASINFN